LLARGRWFSPGTPTSSTTKTGRHDIAEILLKVALNTMNQIKSNQIFYCSAKKGKFVTVFITFVVMDINLSVFSLHTRIKG
jgi:hypothetical protein